MKKTILVVDDDKSNLLRAKMLLEKEYHVILVISGKQALQFLQMKTPDLILLDIEMPEINGYMVLELIQQNKEWEKIPVIFLSASIDKETEMKCFQKGAIDFIGKPFEPEIMCSRIKKAVELENYRKELELYKSKLEIEVQEQAQRIYDIQKNVIMSMANIVESRDGSTGEHVKRTSLYVEMIGKELINKGYFEDLFTEKYYADLCNAAPIHDIGKIKISDNILLKPGALTQEEFDIMKGHTIEGGKIIKQTMWDIEEKGYLEVAMEVATYHHEKWDGTGYPYGLEGKKIPLGARIMAIADVFDALVSERCYKKAMEFDKAIEVITLLKGTHFDPVITDVFLSLKNRIKALVQERSIIKM